MTPDERRLHATWPFVRAHLPPPPGRVLDIGCGRRGGFVPALRRGGYDAVGVDPQAPAGPEYDRTEFERYAAPQPLAAVVASTSLHHVADLDLVLDRISAALTPGGAFVVTEWTWERMDEATAQWCFARLRPTYEPGWLHHRRAEWTAAAEPWDAYMAAWARNHGLHTSEDIRRGLDARFDCELSAAGPYYFADLDETSEADERAAIDAGTIQPGAVRYVGRRP